MGAAGSDGISISTHRTMFIEGDFNCIRPGYTYTDDGSGKSNNGHGNNVDGVDSSNPGNSKTGEDTNPDVDDEKKNNGNGNGKGKGNGKGNGNNTTITVEDTVVKVPVLIAADNLTVLSNNWDDQNSKLIQPGKHNQSKKASATTLNAAVMIGYNDPNALAGNPGTKYTGGAHNLVRYRENWSGIDYNFSGSYMSLWHAQDSHCLTGITYSPPNRNINYDPDFFTTEPPGMPMGYTAPSTVYWKDISMADAVIIKEEFEASLTK